MHPQCPHCFTRAARASCDRCTRPMCVDCITYGVGSYSKVCALCANQIAEEVEGIDRQVKGQSADRGERRDQS